MTLRISNATGDVTLTVPPSISRYSAERFVRKMSGWLDERLAKRPAPIAPCIGGEILVEGERVRLALSAVKRVRFDGRTISLPGPEPRVTGQVKAFLKTRARDRLAAASEGYAARLGRPIAAITLRDPRTRWGSCTAEGRLMFSWRLIMAPPPVLDYVAAHEVAHLEELNHSPAFWQVLGRLMPGYEAPQEWLQQNGTELHRLQM